MARPNFQIHLNRWIGWSMPKALLARAVPGRFRCLAAARILTAAALLFPAGSAAAKSCVWKVTSGSETLYLAGSIHALRASDYPLPPEYDQAFDASAGLAFETDPNIPAQKWAKALARAGTLPDGVALRDRVDPRTYAYLQRVLAHTHGATAPEKKIEHLKPWVISWILQPPGGGVPGMAHARGVESYLVARARAAHKTMTGLVPFEQHIAVYGGMNDTDSEASLLLAFINLNTSSAELQRILAAWRRGDTATIDASIKAEYRDAPSLRRRIITDRTAAWLPKIDGFLRSGKTWMVVAGSAHMAGDEGLPALLQAQGYRVEQF
jgi:uncharacterized protein YbaP (TraB family)